MSDLISRQAAIDAATFSAAEWDGAYVQDLNVRIRDAIKGVPSAQPDFDAYCDRLWKAAYERGKREGRADIVRCKDCIFYDPEHIEKDGVRYEYKDMPEDAFGCPFTGLVHSEYGINIGGRCCKDYYVGYSEDKRVFRTEADFCSRAERRTDE